ncbi:PREDICTED: trypsin 3A1-like [Bactrocera latifrons]|uniref:Trypsin-4 n=1 Tax=Bactrocera latifrons TaxID=174628 RepID=A0A0K8U661_BACLA|nr:PREDICTED: trypsin 3A1-like [Bactrocera latifrons]
MLNLRFQLFTVIALSALSWIQAASIFSGASFSRIVGGSSAVSMNIPYIVSLKSFGFHICGGSIINARTVVTAAHCLLASDARDLQIHAGAKTRSSHEGVLIKVAAIHYDRRFSMETMDYDIGLVRLSNALIFSIRIQPIALPAAGELVLDTDVGLVAGWGYKSAYGPGSYVLRYARVPIINQTVCNEQLEGSVTDRMLCAGYAEGGIDACQMDSGGPLVVDEKLVGIVSWGVGCARPNRPGVYTRVSQLIDWVQTTLAEKYADSIPRDRKK